MFDKSILIYTARVREFDTSVLSHINVYVFFISVKIESNILPAWNYGGIVFGRKDAGGLKQSNPLDVNGLFFRF